MRSHESKNAVSVTQTGQATGRSSIIPRQFGVSEVVAGQPASTGVKATGLGHRFADVSVVQRAKFKRQEIRSAIKTEIGGVKKPNLTATLLSIYNYYADADKKTVAEALEAAKAKGVVDDEDDAAFRREFKLMTGDEREVAGAMKDLVDPKVSAIKSKYEKHIFEGEWDKKTSSTPTGYHSTKGSSSTHQAYGSTTSVSDIAGVYQQSVKAKKVGSSTWVQKPIQSTFFPETVAKDDVLRAIATVYGLGYQTVQYPDSLQGMKLEKRGGTVFPAGGSDTRRAESLT